MFSSGFFLFTLITIVELPFSLCKKLIRGLHLLESRKNVQQLFFLNYLTHCSSRLLPSLGKLGDLHNCLRFCIASLEVKKSS